MQATQPLRTFQVDRLPVAVYASNAALGAAAAEDARRLIQAAIAGYGRHGGRGTVVLPLAGADGFWVLPRRVDTWFAPNPPATGPDQRSSGGILVALRQSPCARAPRGTAP